MKKIFFSLCLCLLIFLVGCKEEKNPVPDIYSGTVSALKNGEEWSALAYFNEDNIIPETFILGVDLYNNEAFWRESLSFFKIKNILKSQEINSLETRDEHKKLSANYLTLTDDGDVVGDIYDLDTTATNNFIQITNYDSNKAEIEGIFEVSFVLNRAGGDSVNPPEKILFSEGKFRVKVEREWFE